MHLCTIITKDHLPWARALAASWARHQPDPSCTVLLVDEPDGAFDPAQEPFGVLLARELGIGPELWRMVLRYEPDELSVALKPWLLRHLLEQHERVVYLDADILVMAPLDPVAAALDADEIVLAPHLLDPPPLDDESPSEPDIIKAGAYNAGFVALRRGSSSEAFLLWWSSRLRTGSRIDIAAGLFLDQSWLDLVPGLFASVGLVADRGCNVAYWNLAERPLQDAGEQLTAAGARLRFFHFSGFDPERPRRLSVFGTRADADDPVVGALCLAYAAELEVAGLHEARGWSYSWSSTAGGIALDRPLRALLDVEEGPQSSIFTVDGEREWLEWLNAPANPDGDRRITRFLASLHASRADLRERFADLDVDGEEFVRWAAHGGTSESGLPPALAFPPASAPATEIGLSDVHAGDELGFERGDGVVCIPLFGAHDLFVRCLSSILAHTPRSVPILIADDAGPDPGSRTFAESLAGSGVLGHRLLWLRQERNLGFVENVNAAFALCAPADVLVINSDCIVAPGWFEGLRHAAYDDTNVATATAMTNHGTIVSIPNRNHPRPDLPQEIAFAAAARSVRANALKLRPRIPTCVGHCFYVRREALDLVGPFDPSLGPAYGEEVDFAQRCTVHGLVHVVADDVLVLHRQGGSLNEDGNVNPMQREHDEIVAARYPYYDRLRKDACTDDHGPLARALGITRRSLAELSVTIDARVLGPFVTGTQLHILELVAALDRTGTVALRVVVPPDLGTYARGALAAMAHVELLDQAAVVEGIVPTAVVHRPLQVSAPDDLRIMGLLAARSVITQQDLIAFRNPGYFPSYPQFARYRRLARRALTYADAVVFFSQHAARDAVLEELVEAERARVAYIGVDHRALGPSLERRQPAGTEALGEREMLLCLGTDFRHKNRLFALRILAQLQIRHGWEGRLVLAGPRVQDGSSAGDEAAFLATRPGVAEAVIELAAVDEPEKAWLYERASALLYPTLYEGFGLMPFEAADFNTPALWAAQASLREVLPVEAATLTAWDPALSADAVMDVLRTPARESELLDHVRGAARRFRWDATAQELLQIYDDAAAGPSREASRLAAQTNELELERDELARKYAEMLGGFTDDGRRLVGSGGLLTSHQQNVLRRALERGIPLSALSGALKVASRLRPANNVSPPPATDSEELRLHWEWLNARHMDEQRAETDPQVLAPEPS